MTARVWLTRIHRWTGLALLGFLLIVGGTGALLPFQHDIQDWLAPTKVEVVRPPFPGAMPLDWFALRRSAIAASGGVVDRMGLYPAPGAAGAPVAIPVSARAGQPPLGYDAVKLDPYTGRVLGREGGGPPPPLAARIMLFLYELHTRLAAGDWGAWLLGVAALFWTIDCFVGFYLTLPTGPVGWWRRWRQAFKIRLPARSAIRFNFDLHRAAGLWLWPMLFVFAWSSVGMNLRSVYDPVMGALTDFSPGQEPPPPRASRLPVLDFEPALRLSRQLVAADGRRHGYVVKRERDFTLDREAGTMMYIVRTDRDKAGLDYANSYFTLDARTGRILVRDLPTGEHAGNTIGYWLGILHTAGVGGLAYRVLVTVVGLATVALSITGVLIWWKKRSAKALRVRRRAPHLAPLIER